MYIHGQLLLSNPGRVTMYQSLSNMPFPGLLESLRDVEVVAHISHETTLKSRPRRPSLDRVPLVTTYHPSLIGLARIAKKHPTNSPHLSETHASLPQTTAGGIQKTQEPPGFTYPSQLTYPSPSYYYWKYHLWQQAMTCCLLNNSDKFNRQHNIRAHVNQVSLITCMKCGVQYVGKQKTNCIFR